MAGLKNLIEYENPLSGKKGNLFDLGSLWQLGLGVAVLILIVSFGQRLAGMIAGRVPGASATIKPLTGEPQGVQYADWGVK